MATKKIILTNKEDVEFVEIQVTIAAIQKMQECLEKQIMRVIKNEIVLREKLRKKYGLDDKCKWLVDHTTKELTRYDY
jgi:hypothetical protein